MGTSKTVVYTLIILILGNISFSQEITNLTQPSSLTEKTIAFSNPRLEDPKNLNTDSFLSQIDTIQVQNSIYNYPPSSKDFKKLGYNTAIYFGASIAAFGLLWIMPESVSNWNKDEIREKGIAYKWKQNVKAGPVWDHDNWVLNYVMHPYFGGIYYMTARSCGFNIFESFLYSAFMSTFFWEYGVEAFAEIPSKQDLVITPVVGSIVGEGFFYAKKSILKHDRKVLNSRFLGTTCLILTDPFNTLLDSFGYKGKAQLQLNVAPVGFDKIANKPILGLDYNIRF